MHGRNTGGSVLSSKQHVSNVNWRKVIDNFRSGYQIGAPWEILIVELLANSIDAGASQIWVETEGEYPKLLRVVDNGRGMTRKEFEDYHNLGSLAKHRGPGIGWAGVGAKLYIDRCQHVYTEARSKKFSGASRWSFPKSERAPIWKEVESHGLLRSGYGTAVEIMMSEPKDCRRMTDDMVESAILANYNYVMQPVGSTVLKFNERRLVAFDPRDDAVEAKEVSLKLKEGARVKGVLSLLDSEAPPGFGLISIIVHGKTVGDQYDFKQFARIKDAERIAGYVQCDELIHVTTTSKDNFNRKTSLWRDFDKKVGKIFSDWLRSIGHLEKVDVDRGLDDLAKEIQKDLNRVFKLAEIRNLNLDLFQSLTRRLTALSDPAGDAQGVEVPGQQLVPGTMGGGTEGGGVAVAGDESGQGIESSPLGSVPVSERPRRLRSGIQIAYHPVPQRADRAWPDPGLQAILVNTAHPAFRCAETSDAVAFYTIDSCFQVVCETIEDEEERSTTANQLFSAYLKVTA